MSVLYLTPKNPPTLEAMIIPDEITEEFANEFEEWFDSNTAYVCDWEKLENEPIQIYSGDDVFESGDIVVIDQDREYMHFKKSQTVEFTEQYIVSI